MNTTVFIKRYTAKNKTGYKWFSGFILREIESINKLDVTRSEKIL